MVKNCYICARKLLGRFEYDHFPIPKRAGGDHVLPICISCHDGKDRYPLHKWDICEAYNSLHNLWNNSSTEERIILCKLISAACDSSHMEAYLKEKHRIKQNEYN